MSLRRAIELVDEGGFVALAQGIYRFFRYRIRRTSGPIRPYIRALQYRFQWGSSTPSQYCLIEIDPSDIEYLMAPSFQGYLLRAGSYIIDGDWDTRLRNKQLVYEGNYEESFNDRGVVSFKDFTFYHSLKNHFENEVPWEQTEFYDWLVTNIDSEISRYETHDEINRRLSFLDELYYSIKEEGYRSQRQLGMRHLVYPPEYDEILVNVDREGNLVLDDGKHRLCVAKIVGVDKVPVRIFVRHKKWQQIRHEVHQNGESFLESLSGIDKEHPDLSDVIID